MPVYSHSRLGTFETCPLQYKYRYIDKIKRDRESIEAFMGKRVHETLEKLYKDIKVTKVPSLGDLLTFYTDAWRKNWTGNVEIIRKDYTEENYRKLGERCIRDYYRRYYPFDQGKTIGLEQQIFIKLDEEGVYQLVGYIDRLSQAPDGTIEIHDYKTGQSLPTQEKVDEDRQLALYQIGIQQKWPDMKSFKLIWHYMAFDRDLVSERSKKNLNQIRQETIAVIDEIEKTQEFLPRENPVCPWCEFKEICPLMKHAQKIEQLPVNEYLSEPGIRLVNRYAELSEKKNQMLEEIESELEKIREALVQYAEKEGVEVIQGVNHKMKVKAKQILKFPTKDDPRRMDLEKIIKRAGEWEHFSELSLSSLGEAFQNKALPEDLLEKIKKFTELEKSYRFYLSKLKTE